MAARGFDRSGSSFSFRISSTFQEQRVVPQRGYYFIQQLYAFDLLVLKLTYNVFYFKVVCSPETKTQLIEIMGSVQDNVAETCAIYYERFRRQTHVTPKSYLSFLEGYKVLYKAKHLHIAELARRFYWFR